MLVVFALKKKIRNIVPRVLSPLSRHDKTLGMRLSIVMLDVIRCIEFNRNVYIFLHNLNTFGLEVGSQSYSPSCILIRKVDKNPITSLNAKLKERYKKYKLETQRQYTTMRTSWNTNHYMCKTFVIGYPYLMLSLGSVFSSSNTRIETSWDISSSWPLKRTSLSVNFIRNDKIIYT